MVKDADLETRLLSAKDLRSILPSAPTKFAGGLFSAQDGRAEPELVTKAIANTTINYGAKIISNCAIRGIETTGGNLSGVVTEHRVISCHSVLVAGGIWTRTFLKTISLEFKQLPVIGTVARIEPATSGHEICFGAKDLAFRKRIDGGYSIAVRNANIVPIGLDNLLLAPDYLPQLHKNWRSLRLRLRRKHSLPQLGHSKNFCVNDITPFERHRIITDAPYSSIAKRALNNLIKAFPEFSGSRITRAWSGIMDVTPSSLPVISESPIPGLFIASGFSGHGFGIGAAAGRLAAEIITSSQPSVNPAPFSYSQNINL